jgi:tetratricopeptide (TPR) repeat protein
VLASDYANGWNEAADHGSAGATRLLEDARLAANRALEPPSSLAYYAHGLVLRGEGAHEKARHAFQDAIEQDSEFARAYAQKGTQLMYLGEFDGALAAIDEAIKIALGSGDHSLGIMKFNRGRALLFGNRDAEAIKSFEEALALRDNVWFTWLYLVSAYALDKKISKAKAKLKEFKKSSVKDANSYTTIAR